MPLNRSREPFSSPDWIFELKYAGFRALVELDCDRCRLLSRNRNPFASFYDLAERSGALFPQHLVVLDGEIVCLDKRDRPQFNNLLFRRGESSFIAFDFLYDTGKDLRCEQLLDRKAELGRLLRYVSKDAAVMYADHIEQQGEPCFNESAN